MARTVKCPGCGADLTVKDDNRDTSALIYLTMVVAYDIFDI